MRQALQGGPKWGYHLHTLGLLLYRAGNYEEAIRQYQKALTEHPQWLGRPLNRLGLALACYRLGKRRRRAGCGAR